MCASSLCSEELMDGGLDKFCDEVQAGASLTLSLKAPRFQSSIAENDSSGFDDLVST